MRRKRSCFYSISIRGWWWIPKLNQWVEEVPPGFNACNDRWAKTFARAASIAHALSNITGQCVVVTRWSWKKGDCFTRDFVFRPISGYTMQKFIED